MTTTTSHWLKENAKIKFGIRIKVGDDYSDHSETAKEGHVTNVHTRAKQLKLKTEEFIKMQDLNRDQEDAMTEENYLINKRVVLATVIQTVVILVSGIYQIFSLRKFFIKQNLL